MIKPISVIYPEGGEPLYESPGSGERLTAQDFAARYGYESTKAFLDSFETNKSFTSWMGKPEEDEIDG